MNWLQINLNTTKNQYIYSENLKFISTNIQQT